MTDVWTPPPVPERLQGLAVKRQALEALIDEQQQYLDRLRVMRVRLIAEIGRVTDDPC